MSRTGPRCQYVLNNRRFWGDGTLEPLGRSYMLDNQELGYIKT